MAGELELKDAQAMYDGAVSARINLCVFEGNANIPGEVSNLARMLWFHVPEIAKRSGVRIDEEREGYPPGISSPDHKLVESIANDMAAGRDMVAWLAPVASPETKAMFAKGGDNSMNAFLDRFASERGFVREDLLAKEASEARVDTRAASISSPSAAEVRAEEVSPSSILRGVVPQGQARMSPVVASQLALQAGR